MKIKRRDKLLLIGERKYIVKAGETFQCKFGKVETAKLIGKNFGAKVKTDAKYEFVALKPNFPDMFEKAQRGPQVILPRDAAQVLAVAGVNKNSVVVEAGSGSGFLSIFLSQYVKKIYSYEKNKEFFEKAKANIKFFGVKNIEIRNKDIKTCKEKDADLVVLDLQNPEKVIPKTEKILKKGGWLAVYSPFSEQISFVYRAIEKNFAEIKTIESCQREIRVNFDKNNKPRTRPKSVGIFTGYWTFARKIK